MTEASAEPKQMDIRKPAFARAPRLSGRSIVILSPQTWGTMRISKHHYAIELARRGNQVFFLNPPSDWAPFSPTRFALAKMPEAENLWTVDQRLAFPYRLKFHLPRLFRFGMHHHTRALLRALPVEIDTVWSFDLQRTYALTDFPKHALKIFHPVDEPQTDDAIQAGRGAAAIFSVTREILSRYSDLGVPSHFINHGLGDEFRLLLESPPEPHEGLRVGLSGNFLRPDIDRKTLLRIVDAAPSVTFECWGGCDIKKADLGGGVDAATCDFIAALKSRRNVRLHGSVSPSDLAAAYRRVDAFLICYDVNLDQSHGTNYHKVMEFLAAGHPIVSNNITTYASRPDLVQMVVERTHNEALPGLLTSVLSRLDELNGPVARRTRQSFAADNTYQRQVDRIADALDDVSAQGRA